MHALARQLLCRSATSNSLDPEASVAQVLEVWKTIDPALTIDGLTQAALAADLERVCSGVKALSGDDSSQYEVGRGTRKSERKKAVRSPRFEQRSLGAEVLPCSPAPLLLCPVAPPRRAGRWCHPGCNPHSC